MPKGSLPPPLPARADRSVLSLLVNPVTINLPMEKKPLKGENLSLRTPPPPKKKITTKQQELLNLLTLCSVKLQANQSSIATHHFVLLISKKVDG
jgi:hypothetical protein